MTHGTAVAGHGPSSATPSLADHSGSSSVCDGSGCAPWNVPSRAAISVPFGTGVPGSTTRGQLISARSTRIRSARIASGSADFRAP